jgi:hypothetical protein
MDIGYQRSNLHLWRGAFQQISFDLKSGDTGLTLNFGNA